MNKPRTVMVCFLHSLFLIVAAGASTSQVELITTFASEKEMGVTIMLSDVIEFETQVTQSPPVLKLRFPESSFVQEVYSKQINLPPLYRIDARETGVRQKTTEVVLSFTSLPEYHIETDNGLIIRVTWEPKKEEMQRRYKSRRVSAFKTTISLNIRGAELIEILSLLQRQHDLNIIASEDVKGKVTVSLKDVSLGAALDAILKVNGYDWFMQENIVVIKPVDKEMTGELETRVYKLEYVDASALSAALTNVLTPKGKVQVFSPVLKGGVGVGGGGAGAAGAGGAGAGAGGGLLGALGGGIGGVGGAGGQVAGGVGAGGAGAGAGGFGVQSLDYLVVTDAYYNFERIEDMIQKLDRQIPQINIAVKFIETKLTLDERLGIDWNLRASLTGPTSAAGGELGTEITTAAEIGLGWLNKDLRIATLSLPAFTSLMEILSSDNDTRIMQEPQVSTLDNTMATVTTGTKYPILVPGAEGGVLGTQVPTYEEQDINITLNVIPRINEERFISMNIVAVVQALVGFSGPQADRPIISERSTQTQVMVADSETLLIGGLIFDQFIETESSVPVLGKIPLLKALFSHKVTTTEQRELLIFITPNIIRLS